MNSKWIFLILNAYLSAFLSALNPDEVWGIYILYKEPYITYIVPYMYVDMQWLIYYKLI